MQIPQTTSNVAMTRKKLLKCCYPKTGIALSVFTAFFALSCCIAPFAMLILGLSGASLSILGYLSPYRNYAIVMMILSLSYTFFVLYIQKPNISYIKTLKTIFWIITILAILIIVLPWYEHLLH